MTSRLIEETEIGLNVEPSQGLIQPKWVEMKETNEQATYVVGEWVEGTTI